MFRDTLKENKVPPFVKNVFSEKNKNAFENKFSNVLNTYCWISSFVFGSIIEKCDVFGTDLRKFSTDVLKKEDHAATQWKLEPRCHVHGPYHSSISNFRAQKTGESILLKGGRLVEAFALRTRLNHLNVVHITCRANTTKNVWKTSAISPEWFRTVVFVRQSGTWVFVREVGLDDTKDLMCLVFSTTLMVAFSLSMLEIRNS